jgi:hypothetical protein
MAGKKDSSGRLEKSLGTDRMDGAEVTAEFRMTDVRRYVCSRDGGHLVDRNPCPIHHIPVKQYGDDDVSAV